MTEETKSTVPELETLARRVGIAKEALARKRAEQAEALRHMAHWAKVAGATDEYIAMLEARLTHLTKLMEEELKG